MHSLSIFFENFDKTLFIVKIADIAQSYDLLSIRCRKAHRLHHHALVFFRIFDTDTHQAGVIEHLAILRFEQCPLETGSDISFIETKLLSILIHTKL